ncbi:hypothetical protein c7_L472 [Megavirus courdo7]|uniref:Uncharacterized protein n=1 Tax=Megavirus courdo7 TaxID=1128135 RepID=H2EAW2_9VIRU|nr:hypothetical protein c7_L472 [Megavirus courdo7]
MNDIIKIDLLLLYRVDNKSTGLKHYYLKIQ